MSVQNRHSMSRDMTQLQAFLLYLHICMCAVAAQCLRNNAEGVCLATNETALEPNSEMNSISPTFRYWINFPTYRYYDGARAYDEALAALGGKRAGPAPMPKEEHASTFDTPYKSGSQHMGSWDVCVTASPKKVTQASKRLSPGQLVNMVPGTSAVTGKKQLVNTLRAHYGQDGTDKLVPRTFMLPHERGNWQEWVKKHPEQDTGFWLLKTNQHRAEGLSLVPTSEAHAASFGLAPQGRKWAMIQQYITNPLLLGGRKFHVRLHVLIPPGLDPFRVYMHKRGYAYVAGDDYKTASNTSSGLGPGSQQLSTELSAGHFTNQAGQRALPCVKELATLRRELGEEVWRMLWDSMTNSTARIMAAALADIDVASSRIEMPSRSAYELFGIDFLIDDNMHAWVTEVNAMPSIRIDKGGPTAKAIREYVVVAVTRDMYGMIRLQDRKWGQLQDPVLDFSEVEAELQWKGGWLPLMHLFPQQAASTTEPSGLQDIPWSEADVQLQAWMKDSPAYKQAIADWYH